MLAMLESPTQWLIVLVVLVVPAVAIGGAIVMAIRSTRLRPPRQ